MEERGGAEEEGERSGQSYEEYDDVDWIVGYGWPTEECDNTT